MSTAAQSPGTPTGPVLPSDPDELQAVIDARRAHLAATLAELKERVSPKAVVAGVKAGALTRSRAFVLDEQGRLRTERVAAVSGAVVAFVGLLVTGRVRGSRRRRARRDAREARRDAREAQRD